MPATFKDLVLDANDHQKLADFWCAAMGYRRRDELKPPEDGWVRPVHLPVPIIDSEGAGPAIWVQLVPEPKTAKARLHIDVYGSPDELITLGATVVRARDDEIEWDVLADPEGNEFCVFEPRA